ncbi:MAG: MATE family efflux transporter, partial [Paramuribaculum sp.]|nr:MATE family efflux transporter [Paramuribaculum sp.]
MFHIPKISDLRERGLTAPLRRIFALAIPSIITNITTPLLGLIDLAVVGHMGGASGSAAYIAAIAVGGSMFNMLYWLFVFLRMGTSGFASQALGAGDRHGTTVILARALTVALASGAVILLLSRPLGELTMRFMDPDPDTLPLSMRYLMICIWGAPAVLGTYALTGWFLGMQDSRSPMWVSLAINLLNIVVSLILVYALGMKIEGVAIGTLSAQWIGFLIAIVICRIKYRPHIPRVSEVMRWKELRRFFSVNTDIFLRTLCLVAVTLWFTRAGTAQGDIMLAVNSLLMQLFILFSFFLDGFAFAGESLCGLYYGMNDPAKLRTVVRLEFLCTGTLALIFSAAYFVAGETFLSFVSSDAGVIEATA